MPKPRLYIPVQQTYRLPGPTYRLGDPGAGSLRIEIDDERDEFLSDTKPVSGLWRSPDDQLRLSSHLKSWFRASLSLEHPALPDAGGSLDDMISRIQEDVVIMARDNGAPAVSARAIYVNVSYPSGWCPPCVCGRSFVSIHAPVPNAERFDGPGRRAGAELLFQDDDRVRFVWSLTPDNRLDRRICRRNRDEADGHYSIESSWASLERLYLRVERQVISPIDENTACFFIRIYRYAVTELSEPVRRDIRSSIIGMPRAVKEYKGIADAEPDILSHLS